MCGFIDISSYNDYRVVLYIKRTNYMRFQKKFMLLIETLFFMVSPIFANTTMSFLTITDIHLNDP